MASDLSVLASGLLVALFLVVSMFLARKVTESKRDAKINLLGTPEDTATGDEEQGFAA